MQNLVEKFFKPIIWNENTDDKNKMHDVEDIATFKQRK
jgi:hypothetical protein